MESVFGSIQNASKIVIDLLRNKLDTEENGEYSEIVNSSGDLVHKVDDKANEIIKKILLENSNIYAIASEEEPDIIFNNIDGGNYFVVFDPLDGSQNIDPCLAVGSIFGIFKVNKESDINLVPTRDMVGAAYSLYGSTPIIVQADETGVKEYCFNSSGVKLVKTLEKPTKQKFYCANEANSLKWDDNTKEYFVSLKERKLGLRWAGCMVSDVHRIVKQGGVFAYPIDKVSTSGKLRVLYECLPMGYIVNRLGGKGWNHEYENILEMNFDVMGNIHQKMGIFYEV